MLSGLVQPPTPPRPRGGPSPEPELARFLGNILRNPAIQPLHTGSLPFPSHPPACLPGWRRRQRQQAPL